MAQSGKKSGKKPRAKQVIPDDDLRYANRALWTAAHHEVPLLNQ